MVENQPANTGDMGLIPGPATKIPHAVGQLSPCATKSLHTATRESSQSATKSPHSQIYMCVCDYIYIYAYAYMCIFM